MVFSIMVSLREAPRHALIGSDSTQAALKILYLLVLTIALVAVVQMLLLIRAFISTKIGGRSVCALCYFFRANTSSQEEVYFRRRQVDLLEFVYDMMSDECGESIKRVGGLHSLCLDLVAYVYYHPRGFEAAPAAMDSHNYYVQEAASLKVGFLAHLERHLPPNAQRLIGLQEAIVGKLVDLGMGKGTVKGPRKDAALWSLLMLALHDPEVLIDQLPNSPQNYLAEAGTQHDSTIREDHHSGLGPLLNILTAVLKDADYGIGPLLSDEIVKKLGGKARGKSSSPELDQLLTWLQNMRASPQDDEAKLKDKCFQTHYPKA